MSLPLLTFYLFAAIILGSAVMVVTRKNAIASAMFLALSLISVAGLYVSLEAEFLFAVQILVYTGGVMVLFLFVIMLVNVDEMAFVRSWIKRPWLPLGLAGFCFVALAMAAASTDTLQPVADAVAGSGSNTRDVAMRLFTGYLLPFEIVSVLLLVAMIGAIVLAKKEL